MALIDKGKLALRKSGTTFDNEISDLIDAAIADLRNVGIIVTETQERGAPIDVDDPLITRAVMLYLKAEFGYMDNAERFRKSYDYLKCSLSLSDDYISEPEDG